MTRQILIIAGLLVLCLPAAAQDILPRPDGFLVIETNTPSAIVLVGSEVIGIASDGPFLLPVGPKQVTLLAHTATEWLPRRTEGSVVVVADRTATLHLDLPIRYRIDSMPPGADVELRSEGQRESLGITPFVLDQPEPLAGLLVARRPGYLAAEIAPGDALVNHHVIMMQPLEAGVEPDAVTTWVPPRKPRRWIDYAAAGVAAAAAGVAIYYKFEADAVDDRYRSPESPERGNPVLKNEAERLDLYSLAALGVMQAGIAVLAVRFVLK